MNHFVGWLKQFEHERTAIGDLARDAGTCRRRGCFTGKTAEGLRRHIRSRHGVHDGSHVAALNAAHAQFAATTIEGD